MMCTINMNVWAKTVCVDGAPLILLLLRPTQHSKNINDFTLHTCVKVQDCFVYW